MEAGRDTEIAADPVRVLRAAVRLVASVDLTELADAAIAADLVSLRRSMDRLDGVFAEWSVAAQGRGVGLADGHGSIAAWLGWKTGVRRSTMNHVLRVGVAGHDDQLKGCEPELVQLGREGKHWALRQAAAQFRNYARGDGAAPEDCDGLTLSPLLDGRCAVRGELWGSAAEIVKTALHAFMDPPADGDGRTGAQRRADALVRVCEVALARGVAASRAKANVTFVVDWATLLNGVVGRMDGMFTGPLQSREVERLLCDCEVSRVVMEDQIVRVFRPDGRELSRHPWAEEFEPHRAGTGPDTTMRPEPMLV